MYLRADSLMGRLYHSVRTGHELDLLYAKRFVYDWLIRWGHWHDNAGDFLAELHQDLFLCRQNLRQEDLPRIAETAITLFGGLSLPSHVKVSPVIQAVLHTNKERLLSFLSGPDETITTAEVCGGQIRPENTGLGVRKNCTYSAYRYINVMPLSAAVSVLSWGFRPAVF